MDKMPAVMAHMGNMCARYPKIGQSMQEFEEALQHNKKLKHSVNRLQLQLEDQKVDAKLVRKAAKSMEECRFETELAAKIATACYGRILDIENHMTEAQIQDILRLTVHLKQGAVMEEIKDVEKRCGTVHESQAALESRQIVQNFRQMRRTMNEAADELLRNEREIHAMLLQWSNKIKSSTAYRNKKIVYILKLRNEIHQVRDEKIKPRITNVQKWTRPAERLPAARPSVMAETSNMILQSAMTFITDFLKGAKKPEFEDREEAPPMRSILVEKQEGERKRVASPTKLVHFAPSPAGSASSNNENDDGALGSTFTKAIDDSLKDFYTDLDWATRPKKAKVTQVEILPAVDIRLLAPQEIAANVVKSTSPGFKDFSNLFPSFENHEQENVMEIDSKAETSEGTKKEPQTAVAVESEESQFVRPSTPLSYQQDSNSMITPNGTSFHFSESNGDNNLDLNDDFMLNFSDDNNEDETKNGYNL
ncbi:uncharacterized protein corolla [Drosophila pseudoobscura]|uniref:Uncharacterized protein corolla n=1 Tax=Drosophila pseudoobscura pseudoobscura TaxID=46245 RepID=A0A6I8UZB1_DROPS|nr:uncharacterized protein LOC6901409 [Drosophila pseudoobscura]